METSENVLELLKTDNIDATLINNVRDFVKASPLTVEKIFEDLFLFIHSIDSLKYQDEYAELLLSVFEVFFKLHRIQNLMSKLIPAMKSFLENRKERKMDVIFILPEKVLNYFTQCIIPMASWQVINLMKTFLYHLDTAITDEISTIGDDQGKVFYIEYVCTFMSQLLLSVRMAEHTVSNLVLEKVQKVMINLRELLGKFGTYLVNMEHNPGLMTAFLNLAYVWAELYIILTYFSSDNEVSVKLTVDNDYSACNITYIHSYLNIKQWYLISQRIANFGEKSCKHLMEQLFVQKIRAMTLFQDDINEEIINSVVKNIPVLEENFEEIILNPYMIKKFVPKMETVDIIKLAGIMMQNALDKNNLELLNMQCINDSPILIRALTYICLSKMNKNLKKQKRKLDTTKFDIISSKLFKSISEEDFVCNNGNFEEEYAELSNLLIVELNTRKTSNNNLQLGENMEDYFKVLTVLPVLYLPENIQSTVFLFMCAVYSDFNSVQISDTSFKVKIETFLIGLLQHGRVNLSTINFQTLHKFIIDNFVNYMSPYEYMISYIIKKETIPPLKEDVEFIIEHIDNEKYLQSSIMILNSLNRFKKIKSVSGDDKNVLNNYRTEICNAIIDLLLRNEEYAPDILEPYAIVLKYVLNSENNNKASKLTKNLDKYVQVAMDIDSGQGVKGKLLLFSSILLNKAKIETVNDSFILEIWKNCFKMHVPDKYIEEYGKLLMLIFEHLSNEKFPLVTSDLVNSINEVNSLKQWTKLNEMTQIMTNILQCNFNPVKSKIWQDTTDTFLQEMVVILSLNEITPDLEAIFKSLSSFCIKLIHAVHHLLSPMMIDMLFIMCTLFMKKCTQEISFTFSSSVTILEALVKYRKALIMDRLPSFLQQYRVLLDSICKRSDSSLNLPSDVVQQLANCSHQLEKLTKTLVSCTKDMARLSPYLICDILKEYEQISIHPTVKIHLNTCVYSLLSLCDKHSIAFINRTSSCTEIFKQMYENYSKFKFTGKV